MSLAITTSQQLEQQIQALIRLEPRFVDAYEKTGLPTLRLRPADFSQLYKTIVSQQLSVAAADSIWQRLQKANIIDEQTVLSTDNTTFKSLGLSKQKTRYIKSLAEHQIDYQQLTEQADEVVIDLLTQVTGIGRWTAEIYCLFSLNRPDVFAANDLALQVAAQNLFSLAERPNEKQMRQLALKWSPHRSAAAYLLWAYYAILKQRDGIGT